MRIQTLLDLARILPIFFLFKTADVEATNRCERFIKYIDQAVFNEGDELIYCKLLDANSLFRKEFIANFGEKTWDELKIYQFESGGNLTISSFDVDLETIILMGEMLEKYVSPQNSDIKVIEINDVYSFIIKNDKWILDSGRQIPPNSFYPTIGRFIDSLKEVHKTLQTKKPPEDIMKLYHEKITLPFFEELKKIKNSMYK